MQGRKAKNSKNFFFWVAKLIAQNARQQKLISWTLTTEIWYDAYNYPFFLVNPPPPPETDGIFRRAIMNWHIVTFVNIRLQFLDEWADVKLTINITITSTKLYLFHEKKHQLAKRCFGLSVMQFINLAYIML